MLSSSSPPPTVTIIRRLARGSASRSNLCTAPRRGTSFSYYIPSASSIIPVIERPEVSNGSKGVEIWVKINSKRSLSRKQLVVPCPCAAKEGEEVDFVVDEQMPCVETGRNNGNKAPKGTFSSKELMEQLKRYGVAGVLSYGLLNTVYYLVTFLSVWFYFAPAPGKLGYAASVKRFVKIMAAVWAGSQVTKLLRAAGALALAPIVEKGLSWFTMKFKFDSKGKAFTVIVGMCFGLAFLLFIVLTLLWA